LKTCFGVAEQGPAGVHTVITLSHHGDQVDDFNIERKKARLKGFRKAGTERAALWG